MPLDLLLHLFSSYVEIWNLFRLLFCITSVVSPLNRDPDNVENVIRMN